jgi:general secretion pathway protein D
MKTLILLSLFLSASLKAEILRQTASGAYQITRNNFKTSELLSDYARLQGLNLNVAANLKDESFESYGTMIIPEDQLEAYVSGILKKSGRSMVRKKDSRIVQVIDSRDIRYTIVPIYDDFKDVPINENEAQLNIRLKYMNSADLARNMRPFMSRYGRIIDVKNSNTVHVIDIGTNLRRIGKIVEILDLEAYAKDKAEMDQINEKHKKTKEGKSFLEIISKNEVIFILPVDNRIIYIGFCTYI